VYLPFEHCENLYAALFLKSPTLYHHSRACGNQIFLQVLRGVYEHMTGRSRCALLLEPVYASYATLLHQKDSYDIVINQKVMK
jgi:hypothetical protein